MIREVARREILQGLIERRFHLAILLTVGLVALSLFVMQGDYERRLSAYAHHLETASGHEVLVPPAGLSLLARGLDEALGREFRFDALDRGLITVGARPERTNILFRLFATPDLLFVYMIVMSLIAFLFSYDAISGERAAGTLQLVLAQPVRRPAVLLGKVLGRGVLLGAVALAGLLGAAGWLLGSGLLRPDAATFAALALFGLLTIAYLSVFLGLGLFVSTLTRRPSTSLSVLLVIWCLAVFVLPNLIPGAARLGHALPSPDAMREARVQIWARSMFLRANQETVPEERKAQASSTNAEAEGREERERAEGMLFEYRTRLKRLIALTQNLERLSPAGCYLEAATAIAGTGLSADERLKDQVERFAGAALAGRTERIAMGAVRPPLTEALESSFIPCAGLLACEGLLLLAASMWSFARADVRVT
jgi:ABC-type transport system involved in multi-copper enzyme maturation permease subunit